MSGMCSFPPNAGRYCRTQQTIKHSDGHDYCAHHLGVVRVTGSPYPVTIAKPARRCPCGVCECADCLDANGPRCACHMPRHLVTRSN